MRGGLENFGAPREEIPDLAEPLEAWRAWRIGLYRGQPALRSVRIQAPTWARGTGVPMPTTVDGEGGIYWGVRGVEARCLCIERTLDREEMPAFRWRRHDPPGPYREGNYTGGHGCGLYAMKDPGQLRRSPWVQGAHVVGRCELGGRVWEHEFGYRAQYARVTALGPTLGDLRVSMRHPEEARIVLVAVARRYGVPLELEEDTWLR